jgi:hypothetical protein
MSPPARTPLADLTSRELHQRAVKYCHMATNARGQAVSAALARLATRYTLLAAHREVEETAPHRDIHDESHNHTELAKLVALANHAAECEPDRVGSLVNTIRNIVAGNADPYLVMGSLLEGMVHAILSRIPRQRRADTAIALLQLLKDRLQANGLLREAS